jgi:transcriptional regulator with XRE-family HTH domain
MDPIGSQIRRRRRQMGLTLDDLAHRSLISKPYLSLIETGRSRSVPADEKVRQLEHVLELPAGTLQAQLHLESTPPDVMNAVARLLSSQERQRKEHANPADHLLETMLKDLARRAGDKPEQSGVNQIPVINRARGGYPKRCADPSSFRAIATEFVVCPDVRDPNAFALRVRGDRMAPVYCEGEIIIFSSAAKARSGDDCFVCMRNGDTDFARVFFDVDAAGATVRLQPLNQWHRAGAMPPADVALFPAVARFQSIADAR